MTFQLLTTHTGTKMGKTAGGAVWLDPQKTSPFEFYQYWRNIDDADVIKCLKLLTFVPLDEINAYAELADEKINEAKKRLAIEVTRIVHGEAAAEDAYRQAKDLFEGKGRSEQMPTTELTSSDLADGIPLLDLLLKIGMIPSKGEGRRLIQQKGLTVNGRVVEDLNHRVTQADFEDSEAIIRKGKKTFYRLLLSSQMDGSN
jgi:tyrosyl-tRNA synthetase